MNLDKDDKEYLQAILSGHYAKLEKEIFMISTKLDIHIENSDKQDNDIDKMKNDIDNLKVESSNHAYKRKWQYAAIIIACAVITIITNLDKIGIF